MMKMLIATGGPMIVGALVGLAISWLSQRSGTT